MKSSSSYLKEFVGMFPTEKHVVWEIVSMIILISHDKSYGDEFYFWPLSSLTARRDQIVIKRGAKQRTWSFAIIRNGKTDTDTYRDGMDDASVLRLVRDTLRAIVR